MKKKTLMWNKPENTSNLLCMDLKKKKKGKTPTTVCVHRRDVGVGYTEERAAAVQLNAAKGERCAVNCLTLFIPGNQMVFPLLTD